jgi:peptide/nickel transport system substrate-binding protein
VPLDPLIGRTDPAARDLGQLLYRRLLGLDEHASPRGDLAESWGVSGDGLSYRFTLRSGLRWSDGTPLTVRDVQATVAMVDAPNFPDATLAATWHGVRLTAEGPSTITMVLPQPRASFPALAADLPILPASALARVTAATLAKRAASAMPTSGPFRVEVADAAHVMLRPNQYASPSPRLHGIELHLARSFDEATQMLALGQVDGVVATTPTQRAVLQRLSGVRLHDTTTFRFVDLLFNERRPGLDDPAVRRAVATVVDRRQLIARALDGDARPQVDAVPLGISWIAVPQQELPSAALAGRALDAAGWSPAADGVRSKGAHRLSFRLTVPDAAPLPAVATELSRQLRAIGVAAIVNVVKPDAFESAVIVPQSFDMAVADWDNGPDPDVSSFWRSNATPPHGFNVCGGPPDPFLDRALDSLATVDDTRLRRLAAAQVDARLSEDTPAVFLYAPQVTFAVSEQVEGVALPPVGTTASRFAHVASWRKQSG